MTALRRLFDWLFFSHWREIDKDRAADLGGKVNARPLIVLVTVAVSLTIQQYWGDRPYFAELFPRHEATWAGEHYELYKFAWWAGWRFIGYVVLPVIVVLLTPGWRLRDCSIGFGKMRSHWWVYAVLLGLIMPAVYIASRQPSFYQTYPFYKWANRSAVDFWTWEAMYIVQFASLEFFFRGFMLEGMRRSMGAAAIFVMIVPYCMIHYGKPWTETMGAIGAGLILGTAAMRTRSIWGGAFVHIGVALSMDALALRECPPAGKGPCPG